MTTRGFLKKTKIRFEDSVGKIIGLESSRDLIPANNLTFLDINGNTSSVELRVLSDISSRIVAKSETGNDFLSIESTSGLGIINSNMDLDIGSNIGSLSLIASTNLKLENSTGKYIWPTTIPTSNKILGISGIVGTEVTLDWVNKGGGGSGNPGGTDRTVQYNDNGIFGGDGEFVWDPAGTLTNPLNPIKRLLISEQGASTSSIPNFAGSSPFFLDIRSNPANVQPSFLNISNDIASGILITDTSQDIKMWISYINLGNTPTNIIGSTSGDFIIDAGSGPPPFGAQRANGNLTLNSSDDIFISYSDVNTGQVISNFKWPKTLPPSNSVLSSGNSGGSSTTTDMIWVPSSQSSGSTEGILQFTDGSGSFVSNSGVIFEDPPTSTSRLVVSSLVSPDIPTPAYSPYNLTDDFLLDVRASGRTFVSVSGGLFDSEEGYLVYGGGNLRAKFSYINVDSGNIRNDAVLYSVDSLVLEWKYDENAITKDAKHRLPNTTPLKDTAIISSGTVDVDGIRNCEWIVRDSSFEPLIDVKDRSAYIQLNGLTSDGGLIPEFTPNNEFSNRPNLKWDPAPGGSGSDTVDRFLVATEGSNITRFTPSGSIGINKLTPFMLDVRNNILASPPATINQGDCYINIGILQTEKGGLLITDESNNAIASLLCDNGNTYLTSSSNININSGSDIILNSNNDVVINSNTVINGDSVIMNLSDIIEISASTEFTVNSNNIALNNISGSYIWPIKEPSQDGVNLLYGPNGIMKWSSVSQDLISQISLGNRLTRWIEIPGDRSNFSFYEICTLTPRNRVVGLGAITIPGGISSTSIWYSDVGGGDWKSATNTGRIGTYSEGKGPSLILGDIDNIVVVYGSKSGTEISPDYHGPTSYSTDGGETFTLTGSSSGIAGYTEWKSLKYINNIVVAVGEQYIPNPLPGITYIPSTICWTTNAGQSWQKTNLTSDYVDIEYGDNKYVAIKSFGGISYTNNISSFWTDITTPAVFRRITYNPNDKFFLATTSNFTLYKSIDGITWTLKNRQLIQNGFSGTLEIDNLKYISEINAFIASSTNPAHQYFYYSFDTNVWNYSQNNLRNIEFSSFIGGLITTAGDNNTNGNIFSNNSRGS